MTWEFKKELAQENFKNFEDLTFTSLQFTKQNIKNWEIKFETLKEVLFTNCKFKDVTFYNTFLVRVKFINCEFTNVTFSECNFNYVIVSSSKLTNTSFHASDANNFLFEDGLMQYSKLENFNVFNSKFDGMHMRENIHRKCKYSEVEFFKCELEKEVFADVPFKKCDLRTSHFNDVDINLDDLISSKISFINALEILGDKGIILED